MDINVTIKASELLGGLKHINDQAQKAIFESVEQVGQMSMNYAIKLASIVFDSKRQYYINSLGTQIVTGEYKRSFYIMLDPRANYLEGGFDPFNMLPALAQGRSSIIGKDGNKRTVIPIDSSKNKKTISITDMAGTVRQIEKSIKNTHLEFRMASTKQDPAAKFQHPGWKGAHIFEILYSYADHQLDKMLSDRLSKMR